MLEDLFVYGVEIETDTGVLKTKFVYDACLDCQRMCSQGTRASNSTLELPVRCKIYLT